MSIEAPDRTTELPVTPTETEEEPRILEDEELTEAERREAQEGPEHQPADPLLTSLAVFLSATAAAWMCAGLFRGLFPKAVALIGPLLGAGMVAFSYRTRRPSIVQYLALPAALLVGAILIIPDATGGTANLPGLVAEAIRTGGVAQPPIPFDPGWRFILVVLTAVLATAAASLATSLDRPKLGIFMPVPLVFAAALIQPQEGTMLTTGVALALLVGSMAVAYGVELAREGATSGQFEMRRLGKGIGMVGLLLVVLFALSQAGFLFPETDRDQEIPPKRPEVQPPQEDRVIFTVEADRPGPWRLGVLDVYEEVAWLLPPYTTARLIDIEPTGVIPPSIGEPEQPVEREDDGTFVATFEIFDVEGHVLPIIADAKRVQRESDFELTFDPRTQMFRLPDSRARRGMTYTVEAPMPPSGEELAEAPPPPQEIRELFLEGMPPPPSEVVAILNEAPEDNMFERLQFVRNTFYEKVIAKGAGNPVDVPPARVAEMLDEEPATPYEITAAEAMLARWAGIPSRIGYGFFAGNKEDPEAQTWEVRPRHGSTWLEAYFHGYGWVPIVGTPPRAQASLSQDDEEQDPEIRPTEDLALVIYVPIRLQSIQLLFVIVRYWLAVTLPFLAGLLFVYSLYPGVVKVARRFRRRRWAADQGAFERIMVAYGDFRDAASDLNVGYNSATPLEFLQAVDPDLEHAELAWLVTRAFWGDLRRDLHPEDAEVAEDMARSVSRRLRRAQPSITRVIAFGSRVSLRDPYTREIPNLWPRTTLRERLRGLRRLSPLGRFRRARRALPVGGMIVLLLLTSGACGRLSAEDRQPTAQLVEPVMPEEVAPSEFEGLRFQREPGAERAFELAGEESLVAVGQVYTVRDDEGVLGALQVGAFKPGLEATQKELREGVLGSIGTGTFELTRIGNERIHVQRLPEQRIFLWFPPRMEYYEIFIARQGFEDADRIFASLLAFQRGEELRGPIAGATDPRRGAPE